MADKLVIRKDPAFLTAVIRHSRPSPVEQGATAQYLRLMTSLSKDRSLSAREIAEATIRFQRRWEKAYKEGREDWGTDATDTIGDLLKGAKAVGAGAALVPGGLGVSVAANALAEVGQNVMDLSFVKDEIGTQREIYARGSQAKLARLSQTLDQETAAFVDQCLANSACAEAAAGVFPDLAAGHDELRTSPGEVVFDHGEVFNVVVRKAARPDGTVVIDTAKLRASLKADLDAVLTKVETGTRQVRAELAEIRAGQETVLGWVRAQQQAEAERERAQTLALKRTEIVRAAEPILEGAQGGLAVITSLMRLVDPKLANDVARVGTAAIAVARTGVELVQVAANVAKGLTSLVSAGAMAATGNFIGAAVALIGVFLGNGPTPEEQILEEVKKLREDMRDLHLDMVGRFDRIDKALDRIYTDVMAQLDKIDIANRRLNDKVGRVLATLEDQRAALSRVERNLSDYFQAAQRGDLLQLMDEALLRPQLSKTPTMTKSDYQKFEAAFFNWAVQRSSDQIELPRGRPTDDRSLLASLGGPGQEADDLALVLQAVRDRGWPDAGAASAGQPISNPDTWSLASDAYSQLVSEWPRLSAQVNSAAPDKRRKAIGARGGALVEVLSALVDKVDEQGRNALMAACDEVGAAAGRLGGALEREAWEWDDDQRPTVEATGRPYVPVWQDVPESWGWIPTIEIGGMGTCPPEVGRRVPVDVRAMAALHKAENNGTALFGRVSNKWWEPAPGFPTMPPGVPPFVNAVIEITIDYFDMPLQTYVLRSPIPEPKGNQSTDTPDRWQREWSARIAQSTPGPANQEAIRDAVSSLRWRRDEKCRALLFPHLASALVTPGSRVFADGERYAGACALLRTLVTLAMPVERDRHDGLRAVLDGKAPVDGGTGIPDVTTLASLLVSADRAWQPRLPPQGPHPLAAFFTGSVAEPTAVLRGLLDRYRLHVAGHPAKRRYPVVENSLLRLRLSRAIVEATKRAESKT